MTRAVWSSLSRTRIRPTPLSPPPPTDPPRATRRCSSGRSTSRPPCRCRWAVRVRRRSCSRGNRRARRRLAVPMRRRCLRSCASRRETTRLRRYSRARRWESSRTGTASTALSARRPPCAGASCPPPARTRGPLASGSRAPTPRARRAHARPASASSTARRASRVRRARTVRTRTRRGVWTARATPTRPSTARAWTTARATRAIGRRRTRRRSCACARAATTRTIRRGRTSASGAPWGPTRSTKRRCLLPTACAARDPCRSLRPACTRASLRRPARVALPKGRLLGSSSGASWPLPPPDFSGAPCGSGASGVASNWRQRTGSSTLTPCACSSSSGRAPSARCTLLSGATPKWR
eukprot:Opistho-1_new@26010